MTLDMDAPSGEGATLVHRRSRTEPVRPTAERGDLRVTGHIPHSLDGIFVYVSPQGETGTRVHSLRLNMARVFWSCHPWAGLGQTLVPPARDAAHAKRYTFEPIPAEDWTDPDADLTCLARTDLWTGVRTVRDFGEAAIVSGFLAVPKEDDAPEEQAWLMGFVYDGGRGISTFYILDAETLTTQAQILMPEPVPSESYGSWIADLR